VEIGQRTVSSVMAEEFVLRDRLDAEEAAVPCAREVSLSQGTVRNYLSSASAKLGVSNRHEAIAKARQMGWI
jgi:hypothetical protein